MEIHTLVGAYVLDAVDDLERASFERHLRDCESCRAEVAELRETTARLADNTWSVPPPRLRDNVLDEIARTRQVPPGDQLAADRRRGASRWRRLTAVAAAAVAAVATGTTVYAVQEQRVRSERAQAQEALALEARTRAILSAPDLVVRSQDMVGGGRVSVAISKLHNAGVVSFAAPAAPGDGRVFQLWTIPRGGTAVPGPAMKVGQREMTGVLDGLPQVAEFGVTVEPEGGSKVPSSMIADLKFT